MFLLKFVDQAFHSTIDKLVTLRHSKAWSKFCQQWDVSLTEEDWSDLAVKSCHLHFKHSPTCQSPSMWCAKSCLSLAAQDKCNDPLVRFWTHLLAICDTVKAKGWSGLVTPMEIFNGCRKNPKRFFAQLCNKVELKHRNLNPLMEIATQMAQAGCPWNEDQLKGEILSNMTRSALKKAQLDLALHLANQIAIGRHAEGGQLCFEVANTILSTQRRSPVSSANSIPVNVMSFALNWIPKEDLNEVTNQLVNYTSNDRWEPCESKWPLVNDCDPMASLKGESARKGRKFCQIYLLLLRRLSEKTLDTTEDASPLLYFSISQLEQTNKLVTPQEELLSETECNVEKEASSSPVPVEDKVSVELDKSPEPSEVVDSSETVTSTPPHRNTFPRGLMTFATQLMMKRLENE